MAKHKPSAPLLLPSDELILILQHSYRHEREQLKLQPTFTTANEALKWIKSHTTRYARLF